MAKSLTREDIPKTAAHSKLITQKQLLDNDVANYEKRLADEKKFDEDKIKKEFLEHKAKQEAVKESIPKKQPKKIISRSPPPGGITENNSYDDELKKFSEERIQRLWKEWDDRRISIIKGREPMPEPSDPFWEQARETHTPNQYSLITRSGSLYDIIYTARKDLQLDAERMEELRNGRVTE
jgi:hypothetical protein